MNTHMILLSSAYSINNRIAIDLVNKSEDELSQVINKIVNKCGDDYLYQRILFLLMILVGSQLLIMINFLKV